MMAAILTIGTILISSIIIYIAAKRFAESSSGIGDYLNLPRDIKGATFDAISSSLPELLIALFSVIFFKQFEVGVGTIAGSAMFNLLIIPGVCVLIAPAAFTVNKKVVSRDAIFYLASVFTLITLIIFMKTWGLITALILIGMYALYLKEMHRHTKEYEKDNAKEKNKEFRLRKEISIFVGLLIIIGFATYFLTKASIDLATILHISPIIIAFTITAAATSIPDMIISFVNAKKGDVDDATSNVFGSNIFDIFVGIGLPLLIYITFAGAVEMTFQYIEILFMLLGATILITYFFSENNTLSKKRGIMLLVLYALFLSYIVFLALQQATG